MDQKTQKMRILEKPLMRFPDVRQRSGTVLNGEAAVRFWVSGVGSSALRSCRDSSIPTEIRCRLNSASLDPVIFQLTPQIRSYI